MANIIGNYVKGRWVELASLPAGTDVILIVLLKVSGLPTDATLKNCQYLSDVFTAGATEANFTNYARISIGTPASISVNTVSGVTTVDIPDQQISGAGGALNNDLGALLTCYKKTSGTLDSGVKVLGKYDYTYSTTGGNLPIAIPSLGTAT